MAYDLVIKNGTVVDGTGGAAYRADVALKDGKIAEIGDLKGSAAGKTLDADGLTVAPGFFDVHTHYDCQLLWDPLATSSCWQGVTTVLMGNCGFTIAPGRPSDAEYLMRLMARVEGIPLDVLRNGIDWTWDSFGTYLDRIGEGLGVNVGAQVGHSALRYYVMGKESYEREATGEEIAEMKQILREAMQQGAIGFSSAQTAHHTGGYGEPIPSRLSSREELTGLCGVLSEFDRGVIGMNPHPGGSFISQEFEDVLVSLPQIAKKPVLWNQLMHRWEEPNRWRETLAFMDRAGADGSPIYAVARTQRMDLEFNLGATYMFDGLPTWKETINKPHAQKLEALADPALRDHLRTEWEGLISGTPSRRLALLEVARVKDQRNKGLEGQGVGDLAAKAGKHPMDYILDLSLQEDLETQFVYMGSLNGDPEAVSQMITHPYCLPGLSDAGAHLDMDCGVDFTSVLLGQWVRERQVMTLEEGIRRLTSMPAGVLGLKDRGVLKEGKAGDVVVFDPETIKALPRQMADDLPGGGKRIIQKAEGVRAVMVNGEVLLENGQHTGAAPGKVVH